MFSYRIISEGPFVEVLHEDNVFDVCGPWESLPAAINWADAYVQRRNAGVEDPYIA